MKAILTNLFLATVIVLFGYVAQVHAQLDPGTAHLGDIGSKQYNVQVDADKIHFGDYERLGLVMGDTWALAFYFQERDDFFLVRVLNDGVEFVRAFPKGIALSKLLASSLEVEDGTQFTLAEFILVSKRMKEESQLGPTRRDESYGDPIGNLLDEGLVVSIVAEDGFGF